MNSKPHTLAEMDEYLLTHYLHIETDPFEYWLRRDHSVYLVYDTVPGHKDVTCTSLEVAIIVLLNRLGFYESLNSDSEE